jgi:hypothetical protein
MLSQTLEVCSRQDRNRPSSPLGHVVQEIRSRSTRYHKKKNCFWDWTVTRIRSHMHALANHAWSASNREWLKGSCLNVQEHDKSALTTVREEVRELKRAFTRFSISYITRNANNSTHLTAKQAHALTACGSKQAHALTACGSIIT